MKRLRLIVAGGFFLELLTAAPVPGRTSPALRARAGQPPWVHAVPRPSGSEIVVAQSAQGDGSFQAPVIEGEELPESPAADAATADQEAQKPAVEQQPAGGEVPGAEQPPEVPQPGATP